MEINYKQKYLKYKDKYLKLKNKIHNGGSTKKIVGNTVIGSLKHTLKGTSAITQHVSNVIARKANCVVDLPSREKTIEDIKEIFTKFKKELVLANIIFRNIVKGYLPRATGLKLSYVDRLKDNISLAIQVLKNVLGKFNTETITKDFTSYASYSDISYYVDKFNNYILDDKIKKLKFEHLLLDLYRVRELVDCYCKNMFSISNSAQASDLEKCISVPIKDFVI
jgi:hypothetical protein